MNAAAWRLTLAASVLMGLAVGGRSAFGLFVSPLNTASGMGLAALSLALALGQLGVGLAQPVVGIWADRYGPSHVAFLGVHMPGVIERCGLPASLAGTWIAVAGAANIAGSIAIGFALKRRHASVLLAGIYVIRALGIAALLGIAVTPVAMLSFAVVMGASHMATLPPTTQLVARQHGVQRLGTLIGFVMLVHQVGSFAGIWLGGWAAEATGSDRLLWCVDAGLALCAAALGWPLRTGNQRAVAAAPARA